MYIPTNPSAVLILTTLLAGTTNAFVNIRLWSGRDCTGTQWGESRASRSCSHLPFDVYSGSTHTDSNNDCLYVYYGANCEPGTLVSIQDGGSSCGNYWGTVRSAKTASCNGA